MRFAITTKRAKRVAAKLQRAIPKLSHSESLELISRIAGYSDWYELTHQPAPPGAPAVPLTARVSELAFFAFLDRQDAKHLMVQAYRAFGSFAPDHPCMGHHDTCLELAELILEIGMADDGAVTPSSNPIDLPSGKGVFFKRVATKALACHDLDGDSPERYGVSEANDYTGRGYARIHCITDGEKAATHAVIHSLSAMSATSSSDAKTRTLQDALSGPSPLRLVRVDDGESALVRTLTGIVVAEGDDQRLHAGVPFHMTISAYQHRNLARVEMMLHEGIFEDPREDYALDSAVQRVVERVVQALTWAMTRAVDARIELSIDVKGVPGTQAYKATQQIAGHACDIVYDSDTAQLLWLDEPEGPGLHLFRGASVPAFNQAESVWDD